MATYGSKDKQLTTISNTTETTIVTAGGTRVKRNVFALWATNAGASDVVLTIRDATGGSAVDYLAVKAGTTAGWTLASDDAEEQATENAAWTAQASASSTVHVKARFVEKMRI